MHWNSTSLILEQFKWIKHFIHKSNKTNILHITDCWCRLTVKNMKNDCFLCDWHGNRIQKTFLFAAATLYIVQWLECLSFDNFIIFHDNRIDSVYFRLYRFGKKGPEFVIHRIHMITNTLRNSIEPFSK